jgi:hypothetical protein
MKRIASAIVLLERMLSANDSRVSALLHQSEYRQARTLTANKYDQIMRVPALLCQWIGPSVIAAKLRNPSGSVKTGRVRANIVSRLPLAADT